jgi:hypothetical protein
LATDPNVVTSNATTDPDNVTLSVPNTSISDSNILTVGDGNNDTLDARFTPETFTCDHIELDDHSLVLAQNTPAETFVDNADRLAFDNWDEYEARYPDGRSIDEMPYPRAKAYRQVPQAVRAMLAARGALIANAAEHVAA